MNLPSKPSELWPYLVSLGVAFASARLLASRRRLTVRTVISGALEGALLSMCAGVGLFMVPGADPFAVLGLGGLLAGLGRSGIIAIATALGRRKRDDE